MAEIPLVYPNHVHQPRRYVLDSVTKRLRRVEVAPSSSSMSSSSPMPSSMSTTRTHSNTHRIMIPILEEALPGSASVSELILRGKAYLLTTCAKLDDADILSVALSVTSKRTNTTDSVDYLESPRLLELDYRQLDLRPLVKVQAFCEIVNGSIQLTLVDSVGTFVTVWLTDQLVPVVDQLAQILKTTEYISELAILQEVTGSELQSTMVTFGSRTAVVVALSPFVLTVDLPHATSYIWSETQCLEDMRARSSSFGSLLTGVSDLLLGKLEQGVMDMSPTAALCLSSTANPLFDTTYCITLHSDASLRKWKLDLRSSPLPLEVVTLEAITSNLPLPSMWSDIRNSVSLCARIYDQCYALCVHIKTDGLYTQLSSTEKEEEADSSANETTTSPTSDCHLWVLHGNSQEVDGSQGSSMVLAVPTEAVSLVGMSFCPTATRCSLSVVFESIDLEHDRVGTIHVTYPPSNMNIVSSEPLVVGHGSLDKVASMERSRIRSLLMGPSLLATMEDDTVEDILNALDALYLKFLFRPMFPRGNGTVLPPSALCIRRALAKLVHGATASHESKTQEMGRTVALETVRTMYEWRHRENRQLVLAATPMRLKFRRPSQRQQQQQETQIVASLDPKSPFSVYDAFVQDRGEDDDVDVDGDGDGDTMEMDDAANAASDEQWEKIEQERSAEVEAHEKRWRRLLLQVWEEEQIDRLPLLVEWLSSQPLQVMVRSSITTIMEDKAQNHGDHSELAGGNWGVALDTIALKLLTRIEGNRERSTRLYAVEQQVTTMIANAQLALRPLDQHLIHELTGLARWAGSEGGDPDGITDDEHEMLDKTMEGLAPSQMVQWIQATPQNSTGALPGLEIVDADDHPQRNTNSVTTWSQKQVANYQLRHSACALSLRCIDSVRRLQLSRCLLLFDMIEGSQARDAALRAYLHSIAVLWTSSQRVPVPMTAFQSRKPVRLGEGSPDTSSPPNKRLSFGDDAMSILAPLTSTMTTSIDVMAIEISQTMDGSSNVPMSPVGVSIFLTRSYFRLAFSARGDVPIGKPSLLPELGALPRPKDDTIATDHPRLALRLLAPYVACALPEDSADVVVARKESLAECLLIESHATSVVGPAKAQMRQIACELLVPDGSSHDNSVDQRMIRTAFEALESLKHSESSAAVSQERLAQTLEEMVQTGTSIEIRRLCELETVKALFSPIATGAVYELDGMTQTSIRLVAGIMLHLSRVMYRLTILERHVNICGGEDEGENPDVLLAFISNAINEMGKTFPDEVCRVMPEYGKMWSRLFHHAVLAGHWRTAYGACVRNPKSELRESSFRRLVRSMVDQGALSDLLLLCTELGLRFSNVNSKSESEASSETVDLYEIASDILAEAVSRDVYAVRASSSDPASLSDYQGALYALHASQKHWRRAAQSMDLRYINARKAFGTKARGYGFNIQSVELRDGLIVEDLVLASVASSNSIELIKDQAHKFLVSGEYGLYNNIPVDDLDDEETTPTMGAKRTRGPFGNAVEEIEADVTDRLSNFMTKVELEGRAIRSVALKSLFFDRSTDPSSTKSAFLRHVDSSKLDIDELFKIGYYKHGLLLAKAWANNRQVDTGSSRPEGSDLFYDSLCHMLDRYLIPMALADSQAASRPSLDQLQRSLDGVSVDGSASYIVAEGSGRIADLEKVAMRTAAMAFIRELSLTYSTADTPVAIDVATLLFEYGAIQIPAWLERLLTAADSASSNGLFAPRRRPGSHNYLGDPSTLVSMYTKRGLLVEACNVVSLTLSSVDAEGKTLEARAASRLPEKGDIDYVPYQSIDMLWNLTELLITKGALGLTEESKVKAARAGMKSALEKHFELMKISEAGMRSARALRYA